MKMKSQSALLPIPPAPPPPASALRIGTLNVRRRLTQDKFNTIIARCDSLQLDIIALQEVGDPVITSASRPRHSIIIAPGPSNHEAGVALLIPRTMKSRCRSYERSATGRLVGVIIDVTDQHRLLIVSAYMPSGLDGQSPDADIVQLAHELYLEILQWAATATHVIIMGDLNQTLTPLDRASTSASPPAHARDTSPIHALIDDGFVDEYRRHHPDATRNAGHTRFGSTSSSRIDYIWTRSIDSHDISHQIHIDRNLIDSKRVVVSDHRLLWMELTMPQSPIDATPLSSIALPNLRAATSRHEEAFIDHLDQHLGSDIDELLLLARSNDVDALNDVASGITTLTRASAFASFPITGATRHQSREQQRLQRVHDDLARLLRMSRELLARDCIPMCSREWLRIYRRCVLQHGVQWRIDIFDNYEYTDWLAETRQHRCATLRTIKRARKSMRAATRPPIDANPAAAVHRMLDSNALPSHLLSVVDSNGRLTTSARELKEEMVRHFTTVFAVPPTSAFIPPYDVPEMLFAKPNMDPAWYAGLMADVTPSELRHIVSDAPRVSAPGRDAVSVGIWRIAIEQSAHMCDVVSSLFTSCMRNSIFPSAWKSSIIVPFVKDAKKERTMSNIRPISLQSCLGKLFNKILARRLADILVRHPILNASQRGFITGGATIKCIDELLDAWDWSRINKCEQYTILYDIKQAYDSVERDPLLRSLSRIGLPPAFTTLIGDSLTGLTSCVRTAYGPTESFDVERSIRQGDPLAPLLFVILMDALHDGLEQHPHTGARHGCNFASGRSSVYIASLGYADDTAVIAGTLHDLRQQNEWVQYFMSFNSLRLNPTKCELIGRQADNQSVTLAAVTHADIRVDGAILEPKPHDVPIRYLGVHARFDNDWSSQKSKSTQMVAMFTRIVSKYRLSIARAVHMFNVFLLPKLELALHYVHGPRVKKWVRTLDSMLIASIRHASSSKIRCSNRALALTLNLTLPSALEVSVKASELFLRMNSSDARWGVLGRMLMRQQCPPVTDATPAASDATRLKRAAKVVASSLRWQQHLHQPYSGRRQNLTTKPPFELAPFDEPSVGYASVSLSHDTRATIMHNVFNGFGTRPTKHTPPHAATIHVFTDGSYGADTNAASQSSSSWSLVIGDVVFDERHNEIPLDEKLIRPSHVVNFCLIGSSIKCTRGVYPAELQAIARALMTIPIIYNMHIHSDSQSSIRAIASHRADCNERQRMRKSARPLLQHIDQLWLARTRAGSETRLTHVAAHTDSADPEFVGNRLADYQANVSRKLGVGTPTSLIEFPLAQCENHMHMLDDDGMQVINDIRSSANIRMRAMMLTHWRSIPDQGALACAGMIELGRVIMSDGAPSHQATLVHVATNSHHRYFPLARGSKLAELTCSACGVTPCDITHLTICNVNNHRRTLRQSIVTHLTTAGCSADWLNSIRHSTLTDVLLSIFPFPQSDDATQSDIDRHVVLMFVGAFTLAQSNAAARRLGFDDPNDMRFVMSRHRQLCMEHVNKTYSYLITLARAP